MINSNKRFCVFVPSVRATSRFATRLFSSLTMPTDVHILDGSEGIIQTYDYALRHVLDLDRHAIFVKLDDDLSLSLGWQNVIAKAFRDIPDAGILGLKIENGAEYMGDLHPILEGDTRTQLPVGNIGGAFHAMRTEVALEIGAPPIVPGTKYQFYEDYWRCREARALGLLCAYVVPLAPFAWLMDRHDPKEYIEEKARDTELCRKNREVWECC